MVKRLVPEPWVPACHPAPTQNTKAFLSPAGNAHGPCMQRALSTLDFKLFELNLGSFRALRAAGYLSLAKRRGLQGLSRDGPHLDAASEML